MDTTVPFFGPGCPKPDKVVHALWSTDEFTLLYTLDMAGLKLATMDYSRPAAEFLVWVPVGSPGHLNGSLI